MTLLYALAAILAVAGVFLLLKLNPETVSLDMITLLKGKPTLAARTALAKGKRKNGKIKQALLDTQHALAATGRGTAFARVCMAAFLLMIAGVVFSITINNLFLVPVLGIGLAMIPFAYVQAATANYRRQLNTELETALSIITTSYTRTEDIVSAVEENIAYINPPVADIFKAFLGQTKLISSNLKLALKNMRGSINNTVFHEWCDGLIACQDDKNLKFTLMPIATKLTDIRIVNGDLEIMLYEPRREYITMLLLCFGNIPLIYALNKDWYAILMDSVIGKCVLAIIGITAIITSVLCFQYTRPMEYRR